MVPLTSLFLPFVLLYTVDAERFVVSGQVRCALDRADDPYPYTIGSIQILEHDSLPLDEHDFMGETKLVDNQFHGILFDESEITGIDPIAVVFHDCNEKARRDRNSIRKRGCYAITEHFFQPPEGDQIWLDIDLTYNQLEKLHCPSENSFRIMALSDDIANSSTVIEGSGIEVNQSDFKL